ncbi:MAG: hypothetical protein JWM95_5230 [Gemmatimonadetes bacterium]|nr:hypothetical protein [Gemmatimonadota bacterium]
MIGFLVLAQIVIVAHAPDTATTCAPMEVSVAARAPGVIAPRIALPPLANSLQLLRTSSVSRVERMGNGQSSASTEATFTFATDAAGRVALPSFTASVGALHSVATPLPVEARPASALPPAVLVRAWLDRAGRGDTSDSLYVGQQVDYVVDVQLNESARQRLRRNPTFFPPEMPGVLAYDLAPPAAIGRSGHHCFETLSYRRALFPLFAGRTVIAPAALTYSLPLSTSFFSREESFELRTDSVRFTTIDVPAAGRPPDFAGAVGTVAATSKVSMTNARMGDPVVLTLRLEGAGNVKLWPRPPLTLSWATVAQGEERVQVDTSLARVRGTKEFDWLLTPRQAGRQEVPAMHYPFFDADKGTYASALTSPLSLDVQTAALAATDSAPASRLAVRRNLRDESSPSVPSQAWYWLLLAIAPAPAALRRARDRTRLRSRSQSPGQRLRHAAASKERLVARDVRRLYLEAIRERVALTSGSLQRAELARALRRVGVTAATADMASELLEKLDAAAFSPSGALDASATSDAANIVRDIDAQAVQRTQGISGARGLSIIVLAAMLAATAYALPEGVANTFSQGVEAYDGGAFPLAARLFARVATRAPRANDAWANLGAAAWAHADSAAAVRAWQRALRLDPLDAETRERLDLVQLSPLRSPGYVVPVPVDVPAYAALACWVVAWLVLFVPPARRPQALRPLCGGALIVAVVLLGGALELRDRLDPRGLGILCGSRLLVSAPNSGSALASGTVGETGRLGPREGTWVRLELDGARAGWVPVESVLPLDGPPTDN